MPHPLPPSPNLPTLTTLRPNTGSAPIRIVVVDDHTLFRRGLTALLGRDGGLLVVGDAGDANEAQRVVQHHQPDLILLDNHLPGVTGVDALPALLAIAPRARVLMLTVSEDEADLTAALRAGAHGYLLKTIEGEALSAAIRRVMQGEHVIADDMTGKLVAALRNAPAPLTSAPPPALLHSTAASPLASAPDITLRSPQPVAPAPAHPLASLSPRERDILQGIARGASNKEIARDLCISESTVKIHVQHMLRKLDVSSRVHLAVLANTHGLPPDAG